MLSDLYAHSGHGRRRGLRQGRRRSHRAHLAQLGQRYHRRADGAVDEGRQRKNYDLARSCSTTWSRWRPDFTEGWNRRAYVHYMKSEVDQALGDLRRTLALDPNHFKALDGLAQILREIGQKKPALKAFKQLLDVHPIGRAHRMRSTNSSATSEGQGI
jgi:tetratricopeptide (TPR) repeat protein